MAEKFKEQAVVISQEQIAPAIYSLWIKTDKIAQYAKAGQFISIYCDDGSRLLPRPISICEIDRENGRIRLVLTKKILPCIWYTVSQARELQNFLKNRPEITSPSWDRLEMVFR